MAVWRRAEQQASDSKVEHEILKPVRDPETGHPISPVIAAALCIKPRGKLTRDQARKVDALKAGSPAFATMRCFAIRFNGICAAAKQTRSLHGPVTRLKPTWRHSCALPAH